ncbi:MULTISPECIES: glycosyl transferase family protein [unclassified Sphingopyxis]|uniref:glycosyl transferase family protein n=1 Tax=unclassified Sphingopyxis TaxID=2614943 RepID=UPI0006C12163|nr:MULTISPECIES: glycosyl transferase family protein [unclassified Sphingopyxis]GAO77034.1 glycosyltransferases [Sphingopyxis sp. C-1]
MEQSTAWLEWLVMGASHELMLFASVGILLFGLDDLLFDALWLVTRRRGPSLAPNAPPVEGRFAVFVPAWDEADALPAMLDRTLAAWRDEDFRLYLGCYPNDAATLFAVSPLVARDRRLRLVVGSVEGPTTKGDNLNGLWRALGDDERAEGMRFAAIVLHDAEDHVHPAELALYRRYLGENSMVQIPVVPLIRHRERWIGGHYGDEFAEAHGKELVVRSRLGLPLPSAGVGCALTRSSLALLALERGGEPFRCDSLTEDYEMGMLIGAYGLRTRFIDTVGPAGDRIVSRGAFPGEIEKAVRQKSRWITGIALAGWDHLGWLGARRDKAIGAGAGRAWIGRWMLWRDRRAPLSALILMAAYAGLIFTIAGWAGQFLLDWRAVELGGGMRLLLMFNAVMLCWRIGVRGHFTARWYGLREAMISLPRVFFANVIAMLAARRAIGLYWRMLRSGKVVWDKTDHPDHEVAHQDGFVRMGA